MRLIGGGGSVMVVLQVSIGNTACLYFATVAKRLNIGESIMALTYKLESFIKKIISPVVIEYNGEMQEFSNGSAAYEQDNPKYLLVDEVKNVDSKIRLVLKENEKRNDVTWCKEETATFF